MPRAADVQDQYTRRTRTYAAYVSAFRYQQGLRAALATTPALHNGQRILDAGCGTGLSTLALLDALQERSLDHHSIDAFDLTPAMLEQCRNRLDRVGADRLELRHADVLHLDQLPTSWTDYDVILCASMLEYVPRYLLAVCLGELRTRLIPGGSLVLLLTRKLMLVSRSIWRCEGYSRRELDIAVTEAGFTVLVHRRFPRAYRWLGGGMHLVEARSRAHQ